MLGLTPCQRHPQGIPSSAIARSWSLMAQQTASALVLQELRHGWQLRPLTLAMGICWKHRIPSAPTQPSLDGHPPLPVGNYCKHGFVRIDSAPLSPQPLNFMSVSSGNGRHCRFLVSETPAHDSRESGDTCSWLGGAHVTTGAGILQRQVDPRPKCPAMALAIDRMLATLSLATRHRTSPH